MASLPHSSTQIMDPEKTIELNRVLPKVDALTFPINVPGYGRIENYRAWNLFLLSYNRLIGAYNSLAAVL